VKPDNIPKTLTAIPHWVLWRYVLKNGAYAKVPFQPNGQCASSTDPSTWSPFERVWRAYEGGGYDGIGFALNGEVDENGLTVAAVDIDKIAGDPERIARAKEIIKAIGSYTEISPSGKGVRIFLLAKPLSRSVAHDGLEFYAGIGRYLTVTGHVVGGAHA
jgi:putative DNA primase/helicase